MLVIGETHPVQYHAPVFQALHGLGVPVHVLYGSDFSVAGYRDAEFQSDFAWDTDLLSGYDHSFVKKVAEGGPRSYEECNAKGLVEKIATLNASAIMALGYRVGFDRGVINAALKRKKPLMLRTEASDEALQRSRLKRWMRDFLLRKLYRKSAALLYVGQNALSHYRRLGVENKKLFFSPYCVSTAAFECDEGARTHLRKAMRLKLGVGEDARIVMFCGKLSARKGVDLLLAAAQNLPTGLREQVMVLFVGEGALHGKLEQMAQQVPQIKIHITGFKNQRELSPYYHASDLAVLPSVASETWGLVVNEALHHGLPCIVSNRVGCRNDLIVGGQTGEIVDANDIHALAFALQTYLSEPFAETRRGICRKQVVDYSVVRAAEGIANAYDRCSGCQIANL